VSATLAADAAVPFRDLLLDGDAVAARLAARLGIDIGACDCVHAKYRAGQSLRTVYRLRAAHREQWMAARSFAPERAERLVAELAPEAEPAGPLRPVTHVPELGAVFWSFPHDRRIGRLAILADEPALGRMLGRPRVRAELVAWAAERSATARCVDPAGRVLGYAKVYGRDAAPVASAIHRALGDAATADPRAARLPALLASAPAHDAIVLEPLAGRSLLSLGGAARTAAMSGVGSALALLHRQPVPAAAPRFDRLQPRRLHAAARSIGHAQPAVADAAEELAAALVAAAPAPDAAPRACLHGDVHPGNVLVEDSGRIALVDLDDVAGGPAAADLGLVVAGLAQQRLLGLLDPRTERALARELLVGYAQVGVVPDGAALAWHAAAWMLVRPALPAAVIGRLRHTSLSHLPALVGAAQELLSS
jgi:Ser/Thr protein kinase RdoA (MazF antagonist)